MHAQLEKHRQRHDAETSHGGYIKWFILADLVMLAAIIGVGCALTLATGSFFALEDRFFWAVLYYAKCSYSLAALPFLAFRLPVIGPLIHGAKPTGYDQTGALVPQLSSGLIREKLRADLEAADEAKEAVLARQRAAEGAKPCAPTPVGTADGLLHAPSFPSPCLATVPPYLALPYLTRRLALPRLALPVTSPRLTSPCLT